MTGPDSTTIFGHFIKGTVPMSQILGQHDEHTPGPMRQIVNDYTDPAHAALTGLDHAHHIPVMTYTGADWDGGMLARISGEEKPKPKPRRAPRKMPSGWWIVPGMIFGAYIFGLVLPYAFLFVARLF